MEIGKDEIMKTKKEYRKIEFNKYAILDGAKVCMVFRPSDEFYETGKLDFMYNDIYEKIDNNSITLDYLSEIYNLRNTKISKDYINWFINLSKCFHRYTKKSDINIGTLSFYVAKDKSDYPCIVISESLGMLIAPRIDN